MRTRKKRPKTNRERAVLADARAVRERPSVSDIFDEVDEEVRREQFKKLWDRYGTLFVALAVLIVVAVGGWRGYQ